MNAVNKLLNLNGHHLSVWRFAQSEDIGVNFEHSMIKEGIMLTSEFGRGTTFEMACQDYLQKISGRTLVFDYSDGSRKTVTVL